LQPLASPNPKCKYNLLLLNTVELFFQCPSIDRGYCRTAPREHTGRRGRGCEETFPGRLGDWRNPQIFYTHPISLHLVLLLQTTLLLGEVLTESSFLKVLQDPFTQ